MVNAEVRGLAVAFVNAVLEAQDKTLDIDERHEQAIEVVKAEALTVLSELVDAIEKK